MSVFSWEKQEWESVRAYRVFEVYRDLGPDRSFRAAVEKIQEMYESTCGYHGLDRGHHGSEGGYESSQGPIRPPSKTALSRWSVQYQWQTRVEEFDNWAIECQQQQKRELARIEWEEKVKRVRERHESIARNMVETADVGFKEIVEYIKTGGVIQAAAEGRGGKGLASLMGALKSVAESGTSLDERSIGLDAMMIAYEEQQKEGEGDA